LRSDGRALCWGTNTLGSTSPPATTFTDIAMGSLRGCGLRADGEAECWGVGPPLPAGPYRALRSEPFGGMCGLRLDGSASCSTRTPLAGPVLDVGLASSSCIVTPQGEVHCEGGLADLQHL
jgi:hypothetical protein